MALPVLDGNQSATTLSSVVTGGEHIVAHTVVSLGSTAISNITSAVSGSVVSVSNFPSTQTIAGTVTANINSIPNVLLTGSNGDPINDGGSIPVFLGQAGEIYGTVTANVNLISDQAGGNSPVVFGVPGADVNTIRTVIYSSANSSFGNDQGAPVDSENPLPISGTVTVGGFSSVSVGSGAILIAGDRGGTITPIPIDSGSGQVGVQLKQSSGPSIDVISQTNGLWVRQANNSTITVGNSVTIGSLPAISGTVTANAILQNANAMAQAFIDESDAYGAVGVSIVNAAQSLSVFGAVTAAAPNGSLTTRFGTPTTANVSFATSAVTNANRKYLLIQNVTTGSNVITVGIGFTPTTTQGIQLTAGAGITFESSYIPTGAVQILSSVTASNFTILEA